MGKIKKLHFNEIIGWALEGTNELYPITSTMAVFDENNECLEDILKRIKNGATAAKVLKIYTTVTSKPEIPSNSTYDYATGILSNIESGWEDIKNAPFDRAIWISDGVALKGTNQIEWGIPYKFSAGENTSKLVRVYKNAAVKPETPVGGSYIWDSNTLIPPSGWNIECDLESLGEGEYMWFSDRLFLIDNDDTVWSEPAILFGKPETVDNVQVTVYAKSSSGAESLWTNYCLNRDGQGLGTFDFDTNEVTFESPLNTVWYLNIDNVIDEAGTPIYSSTKNFYTNDLTKPWSSPIRYIMPGDIIESSASNSVSFGAAIYKAIVSGTPSKPVFTVELNQLFDFTKGILVENAVKAIGWQLTPELAAEALAQTKYIVYVSYNNYICDRDSEGNIIEDSIRETGWTDPIKYINIDKILADVEQAAQDAANEAINNAATDLTDATKVLNQARVDIAEAKDDLAKAKQFLGDGYTAFINGEGSNLTALMAQLATKDELTGYVTTSTYEQTANSIKLQVSAEYAQENELLIRTAVGEITSDYIRLQVTEVIGEDVVTTAQLNIKADEIKTSIASDITNTTTVIGQKIDEIRLAASLKAVNDITNKINTGAITVKPGGISLVVAEGTTAGGATSKAVINLTIKDSASQTAITSDTIILNGDTIAASIAAKELNIDNFTYLFNKKLAETRSDKAMAIFGANTSGTTKFCLDGSGQLAGGLITWGNGVGDYNTSSNLGLSVSGHIEAHSGYIGTYNNKAAWEIGTLTEGSTIYPALLGYSSDNNRLVLSTEFLESTTSGNLNWRLQKDGSGQLGRGSISWNANGNMSVIGNITATSLTLGASGATMNFATYAPSTHGVATNGFSYITEGEPILFGTYGSNYYCIPLLKMGSSSGVTYQLCEMIKISNDSMTAKSLAGIITGTSNRTTLYRVKEGSSWVYKQYSIEGENVSGTYVSYEKNSSPREVYQTNSTSHFSKAIYTGQDDQYKIRVFVINNGRVDKAYDTYIAKPVYISMVGSIVAGATYLDYKVSDVTWEYLNALGKEGTVSKFLLCTLTGSALSEVGPQVVSGLLTSGTVEELTLSGAYNTNVGAIPVDSKPFNTASGGVSGDSGTSVLLVTSLTTSGSNTKAYACSAFNSLLYSASVVNESYTTNTITINGVRYTIEICDSEPSTKLNNVIYLIKTT